jgi:hypothetical protein
VSRLNLVRRTMLGELKRQLDSVPAAKIEKERAKAAARSTDAAEEADRV